MVENSSQQLGQHQKQRSDKLVLCSYKYLSVRMQIMGADHSLIIGYAVPSDKLFKVERREVTLNLFDQNTGEPYKKQEYRWFTVLYNGEEIKGVDKPYRRFPELSFGCNVAILQYSEACEDGGRVYNDLEVEIPDLPIKPDDIQIGRLVAAGIPLDVAKDAKLMAVVSCSY